MALISVLAMSWAPASYSTAQDQLTGLHFKHGWPWKIPLSVGESSGIAFLLGIDGRLTAHDLDSGTALWGFQMGLGENEYLYSYLRIHRIADRRMIFLLDDRGYLHALDVKTGNVRWRTYEKMQFQYPPVVAGPYVFVVAKSGAIYRIQAESGKVVDGRPMYRTAPVIARPAIVLGAEANQPAFVVALVEERKNMRKLQFFDIVTGRPDRRFETIIETDELNTLPVSAPLFATGRYSMRGPSTMRIFVAVRRGSNELVYYKDFTHARNPFNLFHKIKNGHLCQEPIFTQGGYIILPNTSGKLLVVLPDGKAMKKLPVGGPGPVSVTLLEMPREAYGVMVVQSPTALASYKVNFQSQTAGFGPYFPFSIFAWNVVATQTQAQWKLTKADYLGEPRLPLKVLGDKLLYNSQAEDAGFVAAFARDAFLQKDRKTPPKPLYHHSSRPGGSDFLYLDTVSRSRMLIGYGELGTFLVDTSRGRPRVTGRTPLRTRLGVNAPGGLLVFCQNEQEGFFMGLLKPDLKTWVFKEADLPDPVTTRPVIVKDTVYYATAGGLYKRQLKAKATLDEFPARATSPLTYHDGVLLFGTENGTIEAHNATNLEKIWERRITGRVLAAPTVADGTIYVGTAAGQIYMLPFRNPRNKVFRTDGKEIRLRKRGEILAPPLKVGKALYVASRVADGRTTLSKIDLSDPEAPREVAEHLWKPLADYYGEVRYPMVHYKGRLVVPSGDRVLVFDIRRKGADAGPRKLWHENLRDVIASPLRMEGGTANFICRDGSVYKVEVADAF